MAPSSLIAVVDDDPSIRTALSSLLRSAGYRVQLFADAESFLSGCAGAFPDCIVTDIQMERMNGLELIEALNRVKDSFNSYPLDRFAQAGATAAMEDEDYFRVMCLKVVATREKLVADLQGLGFEVLPSVANFVFARLPGRDRPASGPHRSGPRQ